MQIKKNNNNYDIMISNEHNNFKLLSSQTVSPILKAKNTLLSLNNKSNHNNFKIYDKQKNIDLKVISLPIIPSDSEKQLHSSFPPKLEIFNFSKNNNNQKSKINKYGFFKKADNKSSQRTIKRDVNANCLNDKNNDNLKTSSKKNFVQFEWSSKAMIPSDYDTSSQSQSITIIAIASNFTIFKK